MTKYGAALEQMNVSEAAWSLAEAKARFSEVVDKARHEGPQHVTRHGKDAVVVVSAADYRRLEAEAQRKSLRQVLFDPAIGGLLDNEEADGLFARDRDPGRMIDL